MTALAAWVDPRKALGLAVMVAAGAVAGVAASRWPVAAIVAALGVLALGIALSRLTVAVAVLAACFFFNNYLSHGIGLLTPDKAIGAIAVLAWLLEWGTGKCRVIGVKHFWFLGGLALWIAVSITAARDSQMALTTTFRYLLFLMLFFLVIQTIKGERRRADLIITVVVAAAAISSAIGLGDFLTQHQGRAQGPLNDPNDFGFLLGSTVPLAVYKLRWAATSYARSLLTVSLLLMLACLLATFSRSALVGLAAALVWALATKRMRLRWGVMAVVAVALVGVAGFALQPQVVSNAFTNKSYVADTNASTRLFLWRVALDETRADPITGVGPGNYQVRFQEFASTPSPDLGTFTTHSAYLNVMSELGIPGFLLFVGFLVLSWVNLRKRIKSDPHADSLQTALAAAFLVSAVGAIFLTEQFYPPLWFLSAIGISLTTTAALASAGQEIPARLTAIDKP